jgi:hypothetical protein
MYYDYRQDEDYLAQRDDDALFAFINGQNDALLMLSPQDSNDPCYMDGWRDAKRRLAKEEPEICRVFEQAQAEIERQKNWTATKEWEEF